MVVHVEPAAIEIAAPPERVREVVLDFENLPVWHKGHFKYIKVKGGKSGKDLVPGDKLEVLLDLGMKFSPVIQENSPTKLQWRGSLPGVFTGDHVFEFQPSKINPGHTTLVQYEDFTGILSHTMKPEKKSGTQNLNGFVKYNSDLKEKVESGR